MLWSPKTTKRISENLNQILSLNYYRKVECGLADREQYMYSFRTSTEYDRHDVNYYAGTEVIQAKQ